MDWNVQFGNLEKLMVKNQENRRTRLELPTATPVNLRKLAGRGRLCRETKRLPPQYLRNWVTELAFESNP